MNALYCPQWQNIGLLFRLNYTRDKPQLLDIFEFVLEICLKKNKFFYI